MKPILIVASMLILILATASVFLWLGVFGDNPFDGWTRYQNAELGFQLRHPENMEARVSPEDSQVVVSLEAAQEEDEEDDSGLLSPDWLSLRVQRFPIGDWFTLEQIAEQRSMGAVQPASVAGVNAYRYEITDTQGFTRSVVLLPVGESDFFELSYSFQDSADQGYEQIAEQMVASFAFYDPVFTISWSLVLLGGVLVFVLVAGSFLLFISKPK